MSHLPETMRASVLLEAETLELQERAVPVPDPDQVLIRIEAVGVCGSDVHFFHEGKLGDWEATEPLVLGHESAGVIVAVGSAVDPARIGERVSIEPQRPDPTSRESLSGSYNLCPNMEFYAVPGVDGAFAQYATIQSHFAHRVPDHVSLEAAALLEPLSVAIATARKAGFTAGSRVLITGAGPIGIVTAQVARAYGASEIIVTDVDPQRRAQAERFGATRTIDALNEPVGSLGLDVDAFVDASGAPAAVRSGFGEVRPGGTVVLVGMGPTEIPLPVSTIQNRELVVTGIFRYNNTWPLAIDLVASGRVDLDALVTGRFGLDRVAEALNSTRDPQTLKSVVTPNS